MAWKQVRDVLKHVRDFYHQLHEFYEGLADHTHDERLALLVKYMGRHEENIHRALDQYEKQAAEAILNTWLQYVPDESLEAALKDLEVHPEMTVEDVIECSMQLDRALIDLYSGLGSEVNAPRVQEMFTSLLEMEQAKENQYSRDILEG